MIPRIIGCASLHVVFTIPAELADIAYQNKAVIYDALFRTASENEEAQPARGAGEHRLLTIAADGKHLGARIGITAVLHTWGSAMTHHPHIHMIVPGGGIALDGTRWVRNRRKFLLPVRVLSKLFRRLLLTKVMEAHATDKLRFYGHLVALSDQKAFAQHIAPLRKKKWFVYAKAPFAGPEAVLAYLSRYTHRVAISNSRLLSFDANGVSFNFKDYRANGDARYQPMTLATDEFIRRFLLHVLPKGFHRIRHYGLLASGNRKINVARARELLGAPQPLVDGAVIDAPPDPWRICPCCGGHMVIIETFENTMKARAPPSSPPGKRAPP